MNEEQKRVRRVLDWCFWASIVFLLIIRPIVIYYGNVVLDHTTHIIFYALLVGSISLSVTHLQLIKEKRGLPITAITICTIIIVSDSLIYFP